MSPCECKYFSSAVLTHPCICLLLLLFVICTQRRILNTRRHLALCQFLWAMPFCLIYISFFLYRSWSNEPCQYVVFCSECLFCSVELVIWHIITLRQPAYHSYSRHPEVQCWYSAVQWSTDCSGPWNALQVWNCITFISANNFINLGSILFYQIAHNFWIIDFDFLIETFICAV